MRKTHPVTWEQIGKGIGILVVLGIVAVCILAFYDKAYTNGREAFIANPIFTDNLECNTYIQAHNYPDHCDQTDVINDQ